VKRVGIALGGGGSRGFAHLGVIKALCEKGVVPTVFSGTSSGAIVSALLAAGKSADEIFAMMKQSKITDYINIGVPHNGFLALDQLKEQLDGFLGGASFDQLRWPLYVTVANLLTGEAEYLAAGNVAKAVQASASIPILFSPVEINNQWYVDGGLLDNVPVKPLIGQCEKIIAVDILPVEKVSAVTGLQETIARTFQMSVGHFLEERQKMCSLIIRLEELAGYNIFDTSKAQEMFEIGYGHVKKLDLSMF
jgi:NTE family protein